MREHDDLARRGKLAQLIEQPDYAALVGTRGDVVEQQRSGLLALGEVTTKSDSGEHGGLVGDPDEYWFECEDCEGTGTMDGPDGLDESTTVSAACPRCGGLGFYEGDADDVDD